jgi:hypothetical protein
MKLFETLWDWLAGEKNTLAEAKAPPQPHPKPGQGPRSQSSQRPASQPRPKRRTAANAQPAIEAPPPALQVSVLAESRVVLPISRKELERLMCLPAADGSLPSVPEKLPRALRDRYELAMKAHLDHYGIRVRKWRRSSSGIAWCVAYRSGRIQRLIESPRPLTPLSCAIFLHEVGHHAIGLGIHHPRCLEEYRAWMYSLQQMQAWGIEISPRVQQRVQRSLRYAVRKAVRRGIRELPKELEPYRV